MLFQGSFQGLPQKFDLRTCEGGKETQQLSPRVRSPLSVLNVYNCIFKMYHCVPYINVTALGVALVNEDPNPYFLYHTDFVPEIFVETEILSFTMITDIVIRLPHNKLVNSSPLSSFWKVQQSDNLSFRVRNTYNQKSSD